MKKQVIRKENAGATAIEPGAIVVCRFPRDTSSTTLALCMLVRLEGEGAVVRKSMGTSSMGYARHTKWRWSVFRAIPKTDVCRLSTERERSVRHVIGGAAGEKLTGQGAGELR